MNDQETTPAQFEIMQPGSTSAIESISRAEVDMQIATAKKYPRSLQKVRSQMMSFATLDEDTAQGCFYAVPRGGKTIQGPSVRLAEIAVSCYGNLRAGSRIIAAEFDGPMPHVTVQGVCHDLENNVAFTVEKRRRINKKKNKESIDEDDVQLAVNACSAIAFRDAVYKVIPMALIKPVYEQCMKVAIGDADTLVSRRAKALEGMAKMGVTGPQVLTRLNRATVEDITVDDIVLLYGIRNAIKDNQTTVDEEFPQTQSAASKPNLKVDPAATTPASTPPAQTPPATEQKPEKKPREKKAEKAPEPPAATTPANVVPLQAQQAQQPETPPPAAKVEPPADPAAAPAQPQPAAQAPAQAAPPASNGDTSTPLSETHQHVRDILLEQGIKMSRFLDFMEGSGRFDNATSIGFEGIPEEPIRRLASDAAAFARCLKYCKS